MEPTWAQKKFEESTCGLAITRKATRSGSVRLHAMCKDPEGTCADVELCAGGVVIRAHKSVLSTYEFFRNLFGPGSEFTEARTGRVEFPDISHEALRMVVEFVYEFDLDRNASLSTLHEVWSFAALHIMGDLTECARDLLLDVANTGSVFHVLRQAVRLQDVIAMERSSKFVMSKLDAYDFSSQIVDCSPEEMSTLKRWCIDRTRPEWSGLVLRWMYDDAPSRYAHAEALLDGIDFARMSSDNLILFNKATASGQDDPSLRIERRLRDALVTRMERILHRRAMILEKIDSMPVAKCSEDICGTVVCTFSRDRHGSSKITCSRCGRTRCEGNFSSLGNCLTCGRQMRDVRTVRSDVMRSFARSLNLP